MMKRDKIFAEQGRAGHELNSMLVDHKADDAEWNQGKTFGFVYHPGNQHAKVSEAYRAAFQYESTLNPSAFPSLRNFEKEVIGMAAELMHGDRHVPGVEPPLQEKYQLGFLPLFYYKIEF